MPVDLDELEVHVRVGFRREELVEVFGRGAVRGLVSVDLVEGEGGTKGPFELTEGISMEVVLRGMNLEECEGSRFQDFSM